MDPTQPQIPNNGQTDPLAPHTSKNSSLKELLSTVGIFAMAFAIAFALLAFVFQSYQVDGPSMEDTLHHQDRLIVWKAPRTLARLTNNQYIPNRGDIIIFKQNGLSEYGQVNSKELVKRVIGLPGEHVVVKNGVITVYNSEYPAGFQPDRDLPYGSETTIENTSGNIDVTLLSDELFVSGDNRANSLDSRMFGPIKTDQIVGKLAVRIYPFSDIKAF